MSDMDGHARAKMNTQIYEEACAWFVEARGGDLDDSGRRDLDCWLRKSPEHLSAYLEIAAIWSEGSKLERSDGSVIDTLIRDARADGNDNVVSLTDFLSTPVDSERSLAKVSMSRVRHWLALAIAASLAFLAIVGGTLMMLKPSAQTYVTALGEQRSIALADGSTVGLNSRSRIRVKYSTRERDVEVVEGQALFRVARDPGRPFIVAVGAARVRAIGTQFDVYRKSTGTVVSVVEGRVAVYSTQQRSTSSPGATATAIDRPLPNQPEPAASRVVPESGGSFLLTAGEQVTVTSESAQKTAHPNISNATAWTRAEIVFEGATLSDVAEEFNRYNERQLVVEDPDLLNFHVSGTFSSADPESLIRFLRQRPGVRVTETGGQIRVSALPASR